MAAVSKIALDFSSLDQLKISNGQYRYGVDLIRGLSGASGHQFLLMGSRAEPPVEVADVFVQNPAWQYRQLAHAGYRGGYFADHLCSSLHLACWRVDLLHALHTFIPRLCPCPVVVTEHDLMFDLFEEYAAVRKTRPYRWYRDSVAKADRIIAISQTTAQDLTKIHGLDESRIDVVYHGSSFTAEGEWPARDLRPGDLLPGEGPILLSPYNLEPRKNIRGLLEAVAGLKETYPTLRLCLFGKAAWSPEREAAFEQLVKELGIGDQVVRLGFVGDAELKALYRACSLFVFPSLYEGFGLPILEAMASGACVIARNASAMAEIVGTAGYLTETAAPQALSGCIAYALEHPEESRRLKAAAVARARHFTVENMVRGTVASYEKALRRGRTHRAARCQRKVKADAL